MIAAYWLVPAFALGYCVAMIVATAQLERTLKRMREAHKP